MSTDPLESDPIAPGGKSGPSSSSADGLAVSFDQVSPDPFLDEFEPETDGAEGGQSPAAPIGSDSLGGIDIDVPPSGEVSVVPESPSGVSAVVAAIDLGTGSPVRAAPSGSDQFPTLDLYAPPPPRDQREPSHPHPRTAAGDIEDEDEGDDEYDDLPPRRTNWVLIVVASYASAMTIWFVWNQWKGRERAGVDAELAAPEETSSDRGHRAGQSRKLVGPAPLPADRIVALGQTIRLGTLEVTPLEITSGTVVLKREVKQRETRRGGDEALTLKVRFRNTSGDAIFVPLDEAFLRARAEGVHDSFIELGPAQQVDMFPLAVASEWSIEGQEFRELDPGESYETLIVSAPGAADRLAAGTTMIWRIRLRVDADNKTEFLGIQFQAQDVQPRRRHVPPQRDEPSENEGRGDLG
jgi:hypothetical protein